MKKAIQIALCAALLAADSLVTWRLAGGGAGREALTAAAPAQEERDPLAAFRLEREQLRARQAAELNDIIHAEAVDEATANQARGQLLSLMDRAEAESTLEGVLSARGFEDVVVTVSDRSANVLVRREALSQAETAVILELVMRETGLTGGNVKIIPVK